MIEIRGVDNDSYIVCDACREEITNVRNALAIFRNFMNDGEKSKVLHVHKNNVKGDCTKKAEDYIRSKDWESGSMELGEHLANLIHNIGMSPEDIKQILTYSRKL
ncbi:hypothetical protein [Nitrosomonas ureae]|uniref:Uncharacterized protein n=1 Tax=Nitrosomonas ureae TaxID=44577 RepID=A0A2T5IQI3_9PROT|nr:hypothetical protein [Nitrosomonas ureae]PTQ86087.1 hypothetical protein C8R28_10114 [Nitrosomonas ureae]